MKTDIYLNEDYRARYEASCRWAARANLLLVVIALAVVVMAVIF